VEVRELGRHCKKPFGEFLAASANGLHVAYRATAADGKKAMFHDGALGPAYRSLGEPVFSPDGTRMAYVAWAGQQAHVVVDGTPSRAYDRVLGKTISFSSDSRRMGYLAVRGEQGVAVIDGKEYPTRGGDDKDYFRPVFSPDSKRVAFKEAHYDSASRAFQARVFVDGKPGPTLTAAWRPVFSLDSKRLLYGGERKGAGKLVVVDGVEGPACDDVKDWQFTADSEHVVYSARKGEKWHVVIDGKASPAFDNLHGWAWSLASDPPKLLCGAMVDGKWHAWLDGKLHGPYWNVSRVWFSGDGRRWAASAGQSLTKKLLVVDGTPGPTFSDIRVGPSPFSSDSKRVAYLAGKGFQWHAVIDGVVSEGYDGATEPVFSPDGKRVAYAGVQERGKVVVVVDGQAGPAWHGVGDDSVCFSPDSRHVAYLARKGRRWCAVVDGQPGEPCDDIARVGYALVFSPSGGHFACVGREGEAVFVLLDGRHGPEFNGIVSNGPAFHPDGVLEYLAWRKGVLCRVRHVPVVDE
jgi:Tol biopolymer transport system component